MNNLVSVQVDAELLQEQSEAIGTLMNQRDLNGTLRNHLEGLWNMCHAMLDDVASGKVQPVLIRDPEAFGRGMVKLLTEHAEWSQATFGTDAVRGPNGPLEHLKDEVVEAQAKPHDILEFADCFLLLMDALRRAKHTPDQLLEAAVKKLHINKTERKWETPVDPDSPVYHVPEEEYEESVAAVQSAIENFERVQSQYRKNGASDTEPSTAFQLIIVDALRGNMEVEGSGNNWSLYEGAGRAKAAKALTEAAQDVVTAIGEYEPTPKALLDYLREYCWRVKFDGGDA